MAQQRFIDGFTLEHYGKMAGGQISASTAKNIVGRNEAIIEALGNTRIFDQRQIARILNGSGKNLPEAINQLAELVFEDGISADLTRHNIKTSHTIEALVKLFDPNNLSLILKKTGTSLPQGVEALTNFVFTNGVVPVMHGPDKVDGDGFREAISTEYNEIAAYIARSTDDGLKANAVKVFLAVEGANLPKKIAELRALSTTPPAAVPSDEIFSETAYKTMSKRDEDWRATKAAIQSKQGEIKSLRRAGFNSKNLSSILSDTGEQDAPGAIDDLVRFVLADGDSTSEAFEQLVTAFTPVTRGKGTTDLTDREKAISSISGALSGSRTYVGSSIAALHRFAISPDFECVRDIFDTDSISSILHTAGDNHMERTIKQLIAFTSPDYAVQRTLLLELFAPDHEGSMTAAQERAASHSLSNVLNDREENLLATVNILAAPENIRKLTAFREAKDKNTLVRCIKHVGKDNLQAKIDEMYQQVQITEAVGKVERILGPTNYKNLRALFPDDEDVGRIFAGKVSASQRSIVKAITAIILDNADILQTIFTEIPRKQVSTALGRTSPERIQATIDHLSTLKAHGNGDDDDPRVAPGSASIAAASTGAGKDLGTGVQSGAS